MKTLKPSRQSTTVFTPSVTHTRVKDIRIQILLSYGILLYCTVR